MCKVQFEMHLVRRTSTALPQMKTLYWPTILTLSHPPIIGASYGLSEDALCVYQIDEVEYWVVDYTFIARCRMELTEDDDFDEIVEQEISLGWAEQEPIQEQEPALSQSSRQRIIQRAWDLRKKLHDEHIGRMHKEELADAWRRDCARRDELLKLAQELCQTFVEKVESGRARSSETYAACLRFLAALPPFPDK